MIGEKMSAKDAAFVMLFILFLISVVGNAFFLPYYLDSSQSETDLNQQLKVLEAEKTQLKHMYEEQEWKLEEENEELQEEIEALEAALLKIQKEIESKTGVAISYEELVNSLRDRILDLEAETLDLQSDLNQCQSQASQRCCTHCYWCDPCYYHCYPPYPCHKSVSVSNVSGTFHGHAYDAIIHVYFGTHPCYVMYLYIDILDVHTIQIVGVEWD
jgi:hypothetical protein